MPTLIDSYARHIHYLRVSVTDRCDLRCAYCLPEDFTDYSEPASWLSHEEMTRLVGLFVSLGVNKIRLTGGEPLLRKGVVQLARQLSQLAGISDLSLSTNATQLSRLATDLKAAGIMRLNVSLDTLDRQTFQAITGRDRLDQVLAGLARAQAAGLTPIKLNMVVQEKNRHEVAAMAQFALEKGFILRLIEVMPMGDSGRSVAPIDVTALCQQLAQQFALLPKILANNTGPARYWGSADGRMELGAITPLSQHFCASCNRVRLSAEGVLYLCLGQTVQVPLGAMLRAGASDTELVAAIQQGIAEKPERHDFLHAPEKIIRVMARTGG